MSKKKILFHSNYSKAFTGFGKNCKNVLIHLQKTGKYEIMEASNGFMKSNKALQKLPWKCVGTLPDSEQRIRELNKDPNLARAASYGGETIDSIIKDFKPDIYVGVEDIWGFSDFWKKKWWNKPNCMIWTTLDSEPILPLAVEAAREIKHYYCWASFAEKAMRKLGHNHVKTLHGIVENKNFYKLEDNLRKKVRSASSLSASVLWSSERVRRKPQQAASCSRILPRISQVEAWLSVLVLADSWMMVRDPSCNSKWATE